MFCRMLTDGQIKLIHENSLKILERIGVTVPHKKVLHLFEETGAKVNREEFRVCIPGELVLSLIEKSGKRFTLYGRDKTETAQFGYDRRNYNISAGQL